jgi:redox-sensitive bicupin YhaK (pirin superfamily)
MTLAFSTPLATTARGDGRNLAVQSLDLLGLGVRRSPILVFDDFRVRGRPFSPHPHAGFSAVSYVFEDSTGRLRSRDSLGNDHVVGRGGVVWTQAGSGVMHEELLADPGLELHGLQFFVNLTRRNKMIAPQVFALDGDAAPSWSGPRGDLVHVVIGDYAGVASLVRPAEPFRLLDVELANGVDLSLDANEFGLLYARNGAVEIVHAGGRHSLPEGKVMTLEGSGEFRVVGTAPARLLFLAGQAVEEPVLQQGPFIMSEPEEIAAALQRYQRGEMGRLAPYRA